MEVQDELTYLDLTMPETRRLRRDGVDNGIGLVNQGLSIRRRERSPGHVAMDPIDEGFELTDQIIDKILEIGRKLRAQAEAKKGESG